MALYPPPDLVLAGTVYGPNGNDFTGTLALPTAFDIATALLNVADSTPLSVNVRQVNYAWIVGDGHSGSEWGPIGGGL